MKRILLAGLLLAGCAQPTAEPNADPSDPAPSGDPSPTTTSTAAPSSVTSDVLVTGNTSWARYVEDWSRGRTGWPFSRLDEFDREAYDAWVTGLECPAVHSDEGSDLQDRLLRFHCEPGFLDSASRWFDVVSLANNHADNHGRRGLETTRRNLERHGIQYFGDPDPGRIDDVCEAISLPATVTLADGSEVGGRLPVAMCGYHGVFEIPPAEAVEQLRAWADHVPVLALPHSGLEYVATPDSIKVELYRDLVDAGADVVLGDHAHWVQTTEAWRGRLIVYSMGNFLFDQQDDPERTRSAAIHVRLTVADDGHLDEWLGIGEQCTTYHDDCLALIEAAGLPELTATWEFGVVGSTNAGRLTHPASPAQTEAILERLDWAGTMRELEAPYGPMPPG